MTNWTSDELKKIENAEELEIAGLRPDGALRKRVIIWVVRVGDDIYVRSVNGRGSGWFRGVLARHAGRIWAGGVEKDVTFVEENDPVLFEQMEAAYRAKYRRYLQYVTPLLTPEALAATLKVMPRPAGS